jgi:hypothetical protein
MTTGMNSSSPIIRNQTAGHILRTNAQILLTTINYPPFTNLNPYPPLIEKLQARRDSKA